MDMPPSTYQLRPRRSYSPTLDLAKTIPPNAAALGAITTRRTSSSKKTRPLQILYIPSLHVLFHWCFTLTLFVHLPDNCSLLYSILTIQLFFIFLLFLFDSLTVLFIPCLLVQYSRDQSTNNLLTKYYSTLHSMITHSEGLESLHCSQLIILQLSLSQCLFN